MVSPIEPTPDRSCFFVFGFFLSACPCCVAAEGRVARRQPAVLKRRLTWSDEVGTWVAYEVVAEIDERDEEVYGGFRAKVHPHPEGGEREQILHKGA